MVDVNGAKVRGAIDGKLDPTLQGRERLCALAAGALEELTNKLTARGPLPIRLPVLLALAEPRPSHGKVDGAYIAQKLGSLRFAHDAQHAIDLCGEGHAGALYALEQGARAIATRELELCAVGGVDSYFEADTLLALDARRRLATDKARSGFHPGEGASFIALASEEARLRLGVPSLAIVRGATSTTSARAVDRDEDADVDMGQALTKALATATATLLPGERIGDIYCDINGERSRTEEWGLTALRLRPGLADVSRYVAPTDSWGDLGAASGSALVTLATQAFVRGYARGSLSLVWCASDSSLRSAVALERGR